MLASMAASASQAKSTSLSKPPASMAEAVCVERTADGFRVRAATPADVPALMRFKLLLAEGENSAHAVRAAAADWLRDGFGPKAGFCAFVAEAPDGAVPRRRGIAAARVPRVAAYACELGSPIVELT